ncbi:MAG TPA: FAD-dependent oxidoreductase [Casimicrobiaceae bacterium]|nr:FAD-dependent oxidoreductase [Casimicrobiaceae bacterium]
MNRRRFTSALGVSMLFGMAGCASTRSRAKARVVVVGGGFGGATAARHLAMASAGRVDVTLVERDAAFVSCPLSNLVLGGTHTIDEFTVGYENVSRRGVRVVHDVAVAVDAQHRRVKLGHGDDVPYDRLILSPGIGFFFDRIKGLETQAARERYPHAWQAGSQAVLLRHQLESMRDGGVFAISIPRAPYRCPPAPYERACQVAWYLQRAKPRSKVLVLDGNEDVQAQKALFTRAWRDDYRGTIEYRPDCVLTEVDPATGTARFEVADDVSADVLNVIPPHGAGAIARSAGVISANDQWCEVDFLTFESIKVPCIHVLGDSVQTAPLMAKAGQMANQHGKVCAAAVLALLADRPIDPAPVLRNSCYSFVNDHEAGHIKSLHRYDAAQRTFVVDAAGASVSNDKSMRDGEEAFAWWHAIRDDMLG